MKIEVTDEAVFVAEIDTAERLEIEHCLRVSGGRSLVLPRRPKFCASLSDEEQLGLLIESMRASAQDTLAALRRRGVRLARITPGES
jgi:hypothetical protein